MDENLSTALARIAPGENNAISSSRFDIAVNGSGTFELCQLKFTDEQFIERVDFESPVKGRLIVKLDGVGVYAWGDIYDLYSYTSIPIGLVVPPNTHISILLHTATYRLSGSTVVSVALETALRVGREFFSLPEGFDLSDLKTAYKRMIYENHPDRGGDEEKTKAINAFYELLKSRVG